MYHPNKSDHKGDTALQLDDVRASSSGIGAQAEAPLVLTVNEVAQRLRVSRQVVYRMIENGQLRGVRTGHQIRVPFAALQSFLNGDSASAE